MPSIVPAISNRVEKDSTHTPEVHGVVNEKRHINKYDTVCSRIENMISQMLWKQRKESPWENKASPKR